MSDLQCDCQRSSRELTSPDMYASHRAPQPSSPMRRTPKARSRVTLRLSATTSIGYKQATSHLILSQRLRTRRLHPHTRLACAQSQHQATRPPLRRGCRLPAQAKPHTPWLHPPSRPVMCPNRRCERTAGRATFLPAGLVRPKRERAASSSSARYAEVEQEQIQRDQH